MTRHDWWLGVLLVVGAILVHAAIPRYEWHDKFAGRPSVRIDRWTGRALWGFFPNEVRGQWVSVLELDALRAAKGEIPPPATTP